MDSQFALFLVTSIALIISWIGRSATASSILRWITSSVLIGLGIKLALPERR